MKKYIKMCLSTVAIIAACVSINLIPSIVSAQQSESGFTSFMGKVSDVFASGVNVAVKTLREARQDFPDILSAETESDIEGTLIQGDSETVKTLIKRIAQDFKKPTKDNLESFVSWYESWKTNATLEKYKANIPTMPDDNSYQSKATNGNRMAQCVMLWKARINGEYTKAAEWENTLNTAGESATELKKNYSEDKKQAKKDAKTSAFWQSVCGEMDAYGIGDSKDLGDAVSWYRKAAVLGCQPAIYQMARSIYANTSSAKESQKLEALLWLKKLSLAGENPNADLAIGLMYMNGNGIPRDHEQAVLSLTTAANAGLPEAMYALGSIYENGGVSIAKDTAKAGAWYSLATKHGYKHDKTLEAKSADVKELATGITGKPTAEELALSGMIFKDIFNK